MKALRFILTIIRQLFYAIMLFFVGSLAISIVTIFSRKELVVFDPEAMAVAISSIVAFFVLTYISSLKQ